MWALDHKEGWALKNWCFELWCWRRLLRVPWTARRSNQSILKEINPEYSLWGNWCWSWSSNPLATRYKELTHWKRPWCWERLKAEVERGGRGWDGWVASPTQWARVWASSRSWWWTGKPGVLQSMGSQRVGHDWETELNEAEVDVFLEFSCFFDDPVDVGNLISGSSVFLNPACTFGSSWFTYCRSLVWSILSMTLLAWSGWMTWPWV